MQLYTIVTVPSGSSVPGNLAKAGCGSFVLAPVLQFPTSETVAVSSAVSSKTLLTRVSDDRPGPPPSMDAVVRQPSPGLPDDIAMFKSESTPTVAGMVIAGTAVAVERRLRPKREFAELAGAGGSLTPGVGADDTQTVPCLETIGSIALTGEHYDVRERKRARNRVAAQRCRMRKIERIEELSERVRELKDENERLARTSLELQQQVAGLKGEIMSHVNRGCRVMSAVLVPPTSE